MAGGFYPPICKSTRRYGGQAGGWLIHCRFPLPDGPGQEKLPVGQVDLDRFFFFVSYKQIKEFQVGQVMILRKGEPWLIVKSPLSTYPVVSWQYLYVLHSAICWKELLQCLYTRLQGYTVLKQHAKCTGKCGKATEYTSHRFSFFFRYFRYVIQGSKNPYW